MQKIETNKLRSGSDQSKLLEHIINCVETSIVSSTNLLEIRRPILAMGTSAGKGYLLRFCNHSDLMLPCYHCRTAVGWFRPQPCSTTTCFTWDCVLVRKSIVFQACLWKSEKLFPKLPENTQESIRKSSKIRLLRKVGFCKKQTYRNLVLRALEAPISIQQPEKNCPGKKPKNKNGISVFGANKTYRCGVPKPARNQPPQKIRTPTWFPAGSHGATRVFK